jgi:hypothetical protein
VKSKHDEVAFEFDAVITPQMDHTAKVTLGPNPPGYQRSIGSGRVMWVTAYLAMPGMATAL